MTSRPIHVLLIEDNPGDIRLVRELFAQTSGGQFTLTHVGRLDAGIRSLSESLIDVILLDLSLPDSQGIETLIRMHAAAHGIPIVLMTGLEDEELGLHLIQAGAQDYLIKGQTSAPLLARALRYAVGRKRLEEELREQPCVGRPRLVGPMPQQSQLVAGDREGCQLLVRPARRVGEMVHHVDRVSDLHQHLGQIFGARRWHQATVDPVLSGVSEATACSACGTSQSVPLPYHRQSGSPVAASCRPARTYSAAGGNQLAV